MPETQRVKVEVHRTVIQAHFEMGGGVQRDADKVGRKAVETIKARLIPGRGYRTGALQRSVQRRGLGIVSNLGYTVTLEATARHAIWVNDGTRAIITPNSSKYLAVGRREGKPFTGKWAGYGIPKLFVRGQPPQQFMELGLDEALAASGY